MKPDQSTDSVMRGTATKLRSDLEFPGDTVAKDYSVYEEFVRFYVLGRRNLLEDDGVLEILGVVRPILAGRASSGEAGCDRASELVEMIDGLVSDYEAWRKKEGLPPLRDRQAVAR